MKSLFFLLLALSACTQRDVSKSGSVDAPKGVLKTNDRPYQFDYEQVRQLSIIKSDPASGDQWAAELRQVGPEKTDWEIASAPLQIVDRRANGNFILHLLDTFRTLGVDTQAPKGPLGSFGLEPPRFAFRWQSFDLRLGNPLPHGMSYAQFHPAPEVYAVKGAALQMSDHIVNFESLRLQTFATFTTDDIEEIEIERGAARFYAQRNGDVWADAKNKPHKRNVPQLIENLTHWRIQDFLDREKDLLAAQKLIAAGPAVVIRIKDLQGKPTALKIVSDPKTKQTFGEISTRNGSVFKLFPQIAKMVLSFM
jgi:hypothetical protein